jgi:competence protein ComEC
LRRIFAFGLISLCLLLFLYAYHSITFSDKNLHVIFCDVGQGDGIFIRTSSGATIIIDGGPDGSKMLQCLNSHMSFFDREIDIVYLTHPDLDHAAGLIDVVKSYSVKYFATVNAPKDTEVYDELMRTLEKRGVAVNYLARGDGIRTKDGLVLDILWPTKEFFRQKSENSNDYSLVHRLSFGSFDALLTGDVDAIYLNSIMPKLSKVDVFKPPHHGSKTGVDEFTFQHVVPKFAVLSYGKDNRYRHPSSDVIGLLDKNKIPYTNTTSGDVEIVSDGKKWWIER